MDRWMNDIEAIKEKYCIEEDDKEDKDCLTLDDFVAKWEEYENENLKEEDDNKDGNDFGISQMSEDHMARMVDRLRCVRKDYERSIQMMVSECILTLDNGNKDGSLRTKGPKGGKHMVKDERKCCDEARLSQIPWNRSTGKRKKKNEDECFFSKFPKEEYSLRSKRRKVESLYETLPDVLGIVQDTAAAEDEKHYRPETKGYCKSGMFIVKDRKHAKSMKNKMEDEVSNECKEDVKALLANSTCKSSCFRGRFEGKAKTSKKQSRSKKGFRIKNQRRKVLKPREKLPDDWDKNIHFSFLSDDEVTDKEEQERSNKRPYQLRNRLRSSKSSPSYATGSSGDQLERNELIKSERHRALHRASTKVTIEDETDRWKEWGVNQGIINGSRGEGIVEQDPISSSKDVVDQNQSHGKKEIRLKRRHLSLRTESDKDATKLQKPEGVDTEAVCGSSSNLHKEIRKGIKMNRDVFEHARKEKAVESNLVNEEVRMPRKKINSHVELRCMQGSEAWGQTEIERLQYALSSFRPEVPHYWEKIGYFVETKSPSACQKRYEEMIHPCGKRKIGKHSKKTYNDFAKKNEASRQLKEGANFWDIVTAKRGTLRRRKQMREYFEACDNGYEDNIFDSTPYRKRKQNIKLPFEVSQVELISDLEDMDDGDDDDEELASCTNSSKSSTFYSPPHSYANILRSANRDAADAYLHKLEKLRKIKTVSSQRSAKNATDQKHNACRSHNSPSVSNVVEHSNRNNRNNHVDYNDYDYDIDYHSDDVESDQSDDDYFDEEV